MKIGLRVEEATDRARWREGVRAIAEGMRYIRPPLDTRLYTNRCEKFCFCYNDFTKRFDVIMIYKELLLLKTPA